MCLIHTPNHYLTNHHSFQSVQMQFRGPVPDGMYHRYVEFRPFVAGMFTSHSLRGRLLNRALHHQHARIYNFDKTTKYGSFAEPSIEMTQQFLDLCSYDEGGRVFTYVLTLDGQLRFTETGKEFGIDLLSKHTMHSDVSIYIAFSGEFFIRRVKHAKAHKNDKTVDPQSETHPPSTPKDEEPKHDKESKREDANGSASKSQTNGTEAPPRKERSTDPTHYELVIDNDSGTYRPNAQKLPLLAQYLLFNLQGLKVKTLDCNADKDEQNALKNEQREKKQAMAGGKNVAYMQNDSMSSLSSSDEEDLDARVGGGVKEKKYKREMHKFMDGRTDQHHGDSGIDGQQGMSNGVVHDDEGMDNTAEKGKQRDGEAIAPASTAREAGDLKEKS